MLTAKNIKEKRFTKKLIGYNSSEVDKFMNDVLTYVAFLKKELDKAKKDVPDKEDQLRSFMDKIDKLMTKVKENEDFITHQNDVNAMLREENRMLLKEINECKKREDSIKEIMFIAKKTSDKIIENAEIERKKILKNSEEQVVILQNKIKVLENRMSKMKKDFIEVVNYHLAAFENETDNGNNDMKKRSNYLKKAPK